MDPKLSVNMIGINQLNVTIAFPSETGKIIS